MRPSDYKTKQKEIILNFFIENKNKHLTASDIVKYINSNEETVGMTTVYRYLDKLVSAGIIRKYFLDDKSGACYQYIDDNSKCHEHFHLKCIQCGALFHIDCSYMQSLDEHIMEHHGFKIDNPEQFYTEYANIAAKKMNNINM